MAISRALLGVVAKDWFRYYRALRSSGLEYLSLINRSEHVVASPDGTGYRCDWRWTSDLHAPKYLPHLGLKLVRRALRDHPINCAYTPQTKGEPRVTFIIGHRGEARLPHLMKTISSIASQTSIPIECIVVEQDVHSQLKGVLPSWVTLVHTPPPQTDMPYCRSWAFNVGRRYARAQILVLHDNDMMVPVDYASEIERRVMQGFEVVNLKRFIFYCSPEHTQEIFADREELTARPPEVIVQNLEGGGSVAITSEAFDRIGGMDESFVGWGGEDNEFWERAQTCRVWPYANLPIVHLWHESQPGKHNSENPAVRRFKQLSSIAPIERIRRLRHSNGNQ